MNLSAIFSKTGKGVQEASGKTSQLSRADRAVLSAIDGKTPLTEIQKNFEKLAGPKFEALIQQLDKDGYIREVSSGSQPAPQTRPAAPAAKAPPKPAAEEEGDGLDFTQAIKFPPKAPAAPAAKAPQVDLAAAGRAEAERRAKEQQAIDYKTRQEAEAKAKAEADLKARAAAEARARADAESRARAEAEAKAREAAEAKGRADAEAKAKAEAETRARADADAKARAESEAKVKAAREAAMRMATEAKAKTDAAERERQAAAEREREANERARKESEDKARLEAELNAKLDSERKAREEAEKRATEASERARKEMEEKAKRDEEVMRQRLEAEMKAQLEAERAKADAERAKADAERRAREEEDRKRREEEERRRKEEDERRAKEDAERRAKEEAERRAKEEAERAKADAERRAREEEDRKRKEEEERRAREASERKAKEEAERKAKEDAERKAKEDADRKAREEADRKAKDEAERKSREEADRKARDDADRRAKDEADAKARAAAEAASLPKIEAVAPPPPPAADSGLGDSLLADLDSFGKREEEEQKAKEEADRKAKEEKARREQEAAERKAKEEAEKKRREEEEKRRKEEEEKRAQEEEERKAEEEEARRKEEETEKKRKAREAKQAEERAARLAAKARSGAAGGAGDVEDDIGVSDTDLDLDDLKRDQKVAADKARKAAKEEPPVVVAARPKKWGKPAAIALFVLLLAGVGVLHVMPLSTAEYEKAASDALGMPVKIASARLSMFTGIQVNFEGVSIGSAVKIRSVRGSPDVGSLFGPRKSFSRLELEGVAVSQSQLGGALTGKAGGENFRVSRIVAKQLAIDGPLKLPPLDLDATVAGDGTLQVVKLTGGDKLVVTLQPKGGEIGFEISAGSLAVPFVPALNLSEFGMKGSANRGGVTSSEFDGRAYDGIISGTSRIRWGDTWTVDGEVRARGVKVAVFAPTLVSDGKVEGRGAYNMSGTTPATLHESARLQGEFKIEKGVLGSFDLQRALQSGGSATAGRTVFNELVGQGIWDKGTVQFSNVSITAGGMNAGASLNIDASGNLSGRVVADVKTQAQTLRATLNISGKVQDPVIRK